MTWRHFLHYWPFVRGSVVDSTQKGPVMQSFVVSLMFNVTLIKLLNKQFSSKGFKMELGHQQPWY